jgi:anti-anti-sigma regulatory factor
MLKISENEPGKRTTTLRLEGRVVGPWVDELKQVCEPLVKNGCNLALDLTEVTFADESGVTFLASLRARGVKLLSAMPFVEAQLKSARLSS